MVIYLVQLCTYSGPRPRAGWRRVVVRLGRAHVSSTSRSACSLAAALDAAARLQRSAARQG
eukprot:scaffold64305_cov30-Phaeocystis_antarctica.AAC.1